MNTSQPTPWRVPIQKPRLPPLVTVEPYLKSVYSSGQFTNFGPLERNLRSRFGEIFNVGADQVALCANATLALAGATGVAEPKSWIVPSFTFVATPHSIQLGGGTIEFADVIEGRWTIAPSSRHEHGFVPVAPFGMRPDIAGWNEQTTVVHDAAASLGVETDLSSLPELHAVVYSLHATKVLGSGEGAVVIFGNSNSAQNFRTWTNFGFLGSREARIPAANAKMSEIQAAYVHAALDGWKEEKAEWLNARYLAQEIESVHGLKPLLEESNLISPYWIVEFPDSLLCENFENLMNSSGIETRRWWGKGCHRMEAFLGVNQGALPVTDSIGVRYVGLPMARSFGHEQFGLISDALSKRKS